MEEVGWEWTNPHGEHSYPARPRSGSARRRRKPQHDKAKGKGKEKGKEKGKDANGDQIGPLPSPFHYTSPVTQAVTPWPNTETTSPFTMVPSQPSQSTPSASSQELISALKKAYNDGDMPQSVKELLDKHTGAKQVTKELHNATTMLGKAQKALKDAQQQRHSHRAAWISHLTESVKIWESQLEEFRKRQMTLREAEQKATQDIKAARANIQQLNQTAGNNPMAEVADNTQEDHVDPNMDTVESQLRGKLQQTLTQCANALGVTQPIEVPSDPDNEEATRAKRARSQDKDSAMVASS